jgi:hypothetical protein
MKKGGDATAKKNGDVSRLKKQTAVNYEIGEKGEKNV